ncbi:hypothetical protein ACGRHY_22710 [Streptomyces sp. HK10]|uniref:hypothetical protein n=1 Tax=Streptomyces sp. HK10 TaxID=3373255 RepID=UPI0037486607
MRESGRTGRPDWLFGTGATSVDKGLAHAVAAAGCAVLAVYGRDEGWAWWQWVLGLLLVWDLAGGVVANGLDTAKRFYHSPPPSGTGAAGRFLHHPVGFTAAHVQPVAAGLAFDGGPWRWGPLWYFWALTGSVLVARVREPLRLPVALGAVGLGAMVAPLVTAPGGMAWLPVVLLLKLVLAHGVPEGAAAAPAGPRGRPPR